MPASDLSLLIEAAREAGEIARGYWRAEPKTWQKSGGEGPVTEADLEVDEMLRTRLTGARPDYGWLSEETEDTPERLSADRLFIVDPIDGTRAFVSGERTFAHSLAVVEHGAVTAAVVYLPVREKLYAAALGQGATLNGQPLDSSGRADADGASILAARPNLDPEHWDPAPPRLERHFRSSLAYRIALVGEGRFDAMLTLRAAWEWDVAAGALIASEAGARVTDRANDPLVFNSPGAKTAGVLAANAELHAAIYARLRYA